MQVDARALCAGEDAALLRAASVLQDLFAALERVRGGDVAPDPVEPLQKLWAKRNRTARVRVHRRRHRRSVTPVPARKRQFCLNLTAAELGGMSHDAIDERVDEFMEEHFPDLDKESNEYEEEAGIRLFTLHMVKCRMTSVKEALKKGDAFLIPIKIKVDDKIIRFKAVFTVVSE